MTGFYNKWNTNEAEMKEAGLHQPRHLSRQPTSVTTTVVSTTTTDAASRPPTPQCKYNLNHEVTIVGWGHDSKSGLDYWLVKNSWHTSFGENGYSKIKRAALDRRGVGSLTHVRLLLGQLQETRQTLIKTCHVNTPT